MLAAQRLNPASFSGALRHSDLGHTRAHEGSVETDDGGQKKDATGKHEEFVCE